MRKFGTGITKKLVSMVKESLAHTTRRANVSIIASKS